MSETITEQEVLDAMNELGDEQTSDESDTAPDGDEGEAEQGDEQTE